MKIITRKSFGCNLWSAVDEENYTGLESPVGTGLTEQQAIDDLLEQFKPEEEFEPFRDDVEADADVLASVGFGTDEDYGFFGED